jgi:phage portal protein BeeE
MAILDRLFPRRPTSEALSIQGQTRKIGGIKAVSETPGVLWGRPVSSAGVRVDEYEALTISAVFAACFRLANVAAMLPVGVYQKDRLRGASRRKEQVTHPASRILAIEANPVQTAFMARHFMQFWKPLFGAACAEIGWDGAGRPRYLWPLEPWRVYPEYDEDGHDLVHFVVDGTAQGRAGGHHVRPARDRGRRMRKGFLHFALESLGLRRSRRTGRCGPVLPERHEAGRDPAAPGQPGQEGPRRDAGGWGRYHGGVENRGKVGVLWGGWKWVKEAGMIDPDKAQLLESRQFSVVEVARWLNVPPHWLAELGRATWANIESSRSRR